MDISTSSASPPMPAHGHRLTDEEYARSRSAVWMSAAAVSTDEVGRVLLVKPTYRDEWLLPGGAAELGESPEQAFTREVHEELGLFRQPVGLLAVHWLSPEHSDAPPAMSFPGEVRHILDGGTLTTQQADALHFPKDELSGVEFLGWREAAARMLPVDGQILLAALRARVSGTIALLTDGRQVGPPLPLDRYHVHVRPCLQRDWPWHSGPVPAGLRLQQTWGWLLVPDGRVVVVKSQYRPSPGPHPVHLHRRQCPNRRLSPQKLHDLQLRVRAEQDARVEDPLCAPLGSGGHGQRVRPRTRHAALPLPRTGKDHIQHVLTVIAVNIERLSGLPPAEETPTSRRPTAFQHYLDQREIPRPKSRRTLGT